jgi:hypothetical protein
MFAKIHSCALPRAARLRVTKASGTFAATLVAPRHKTTSYHLRGVRPTLGKTGAPRTLQQVAAEDKAALHRECGFPIIPLP